jgi:purine-cytosine permease-like protein
LFHSFTQRETYVAWLGSGASLTRQLIGASGVVGGQTLPQIEQLTALFGNLAGVAIQAAHEVMGKPVTPDSVLALMPVATALADPPAGAPSVA